MKHSRVSSQKTPNRGFTIVEIIIVVTVVGILAGISIVGYGSWRTRVATTEVKSDLAGLKAGMEDARNRLNGYPTFTASTQFNGVNSTRSVFTQSKYVTVTYVRGSAANYCVNAQSTAVPTVIMFLDMASSNKNPQNGTC